MSNVALFESVCSKSTLLLYAVACAGLRVCEGNSALAEAWLPFQRLFSKRCLVSSVLYFRPGQTRLVKWCRMEILTVSAVTGTTVCCCNEQQTMQISAHRNPFSSTLLLFNRESFFLCLFVSLEIVFLIFFLLSYVYGWRSRKNYTILCTDCAKFPCRKKE